jgi:hypothetical protein
MAYCASFDVDLAPKVSGTISYRNDNFDSPAGAFGSGVFRTDANENDQGFKQEDFNYSLFPANWSNTRLLDGSLEFNKTAAEGGLVFWGFTLAPPRLNYATDLERDSNNQPFVVAEDDDVYHSYKKTSAHGEGPVDVITHFRMACAIGSTGGVLTAPINATAVEIAQPRRSDVVTTVRPDLTTGAPPLAMNLYFVLHTGPLASQPVPSVAIP